MKKYEIKDKIINNEYKRNNMNEISWHLIKFFAPNNSIKNLNEYVTVDFYDMFKSAFDLSMVENIQITKIETNCKVNILGTNYECECVEILNSNRNTWSVEDTNTLIKIIKKMTKKLSTQGHVCKVIINDIGYETTIEGDGKGDIYMKSVRDVGKTAPIKEALKTYILTFLENNFIIEGDNIDQHEFEEYIYSQIDNILNTLINKVHVCDGYDEEGNPIPCMEIYYEHIDEFIEEDVVYALQNMYIKYVQEKNERNKEKLLKY